MTRVRLVDGVWRCSRDGDNWIDATLPIELEPGDVIEAGDLGRVTVPIAGFYALAPDSLVWLGPDSVKD